ncbi:hypothetical protein PanWU01x14_315030 [Parasponia andersonii]|uniref:Uncharacterized protein n=1 Tax=Parasponia andersonii TaxID=3476 RepID=A0A2P5ANJ6_PARAD|nr:hypothetical protein PanWU01x14_315030 [Parasponia andersonii]
MGLTSAISKAGPVCRACSQPCRSMVDLSCSPSLLQSFPEIRGPKVLEHSWNIRVCAVSEG